MSNVAAGTTKPRLLYTRNVTAPAAQSRYAWSLVAPDQFPDRARRRLAEAKDTEERNRVLHDILHVAAVLTASRSDRPELIMRDHGGLWMPGKDL